jgi:hypothetical protein
VISATVGRAVISAMMGLLPLGRRARPPDGSCGHI